jgi:hypothetical protein
MADIPSLWLDFDEHGAIDAGAAAQLTALVNAPDIEDLVVMSHGWKNDKNDAAALYSTLWANACRNFPAGKAEKVVVAGALWPAKAFQTDFDAAALADVGAGGTLSAPGGAHAADLSEQDFEALLTEFGKFMGPVRNGTMTRTSTRSSFVTPCSAQYRATSSSRFMWFRTVILKTRCSRSCGGARPGGYSTCDGASRSRGRPRLSRKPTCHRILEIVLARLTWSTELRTRTNINSAASCSSISSAGCSAAEPPCGLHHSSMIRSRRA